jgi:hypothetical protein
VPLPDINVRSSAAEHPMRSASLSPHDRAIAHGGGN